MSHVSKGALFCWIWCFSSASMLSVICWTVFCETRLLCPIVITFFLLYSALAGACTESITQEVAEQPRNFPMQMAQS